MLDSRHLKLCFRVAVDWWNSRGCPIVSPGESPPWPDEPPLDQLLYDKRLELDRSKLNILVYEGSTGGDFGLLHTLKQHADVIDQVAAAFDTVPTVGRCQSLTAWAPKVHPHIHHSGPSESVLITPVPLSLRSLYLTQSLHTACVSVSQRDGDPPQSALLELHRV